MALFSMFFFISLYMQQVLGYDALKAGLAYLPLALGIIVSAGVASDLVTRFGFKPVLVAGLVLTAVGLIWFAQVDVDGTYVGDILFPSLFVAVGLGFAFVPMTIGAVSGVEAREAGLASGLINTSQQIGGALGLAILASIANSRTDSLLSDGAACRSALTDGFQARLHRRRRLRRPRRVLAATLISSKTSREHAEAAQRGEWLPPPRWPDGGSVGPGDQHRLQRQAQPQERFRDHPEPLRVDGHVDVGGEDGHEGGDQPPAGRAAGRGMEHAGTAGDLRRAARVDQRALGRQAAGLPGRAGPAARAAAAGLPGRAAPAARAAAGPPGRKVIPLGDHRLVGARAHEMERTRDEIEEAERPHPVTKSRALRSARRPAKPCGRPPWASRKASSRAAPARPRPSWSSIQVSST